MKHCQAPWPPALGSAASGAAAGPPWSPRLQAGSCGFWSPENDLKKVKRLRLVRVPYNFLDLLVDVHRDFIDFNSTVLGGFQDAANMFRMV